MGSIAHRVGNAQTSGRETSMTRILLLTILLASCASERSLDDYNVSLPEDCPAYTFQDFQEAYGVLYCEVSIGCFGSYGSREDGGTQVDTVEACLELSCGGASGLENETECVLDEDSAARCLESMAAIADDLQGSCPDIDDAWFPSECGMAIQCADD